MGESESKLGKVKTCGGCRHWKKMDRPRVLADGVTLNQGPEQGECREGPPASHPILQQVGPGQVGVSSYLIFYPTPHETFPACDRWAKSVRMELAG